jgi:hypothetical protein
MRILIEVDGGLVQNVVTDGDVSEPHTYRVLDHDTEGAEDEDLSLVVWPSNTVQEVFASSKFQLRKCKEIVDAGFSAIPKEKLKEYTR